MGRGERVGEAYVRIHADGDGMDREIRSMFSDNDDEFNDAGRKGYGKFRDGWREEGNKPANREALRESLTKAISRGDYLSKEFFKGPSWKGFRKDLIDRMGEAGERAADNLERGMLEGMDFDTLRNKLGNLTQTVVQAQNEINQEMVAESKKRNDALINQLRQYERQIDKVSSKEGVNNSVRKQMLADLDNLREGFRDAGIATSEFEDHVGRLRVQLGAGASFMERWRRSIDTVADRTSRAFGKGSRNDFLNFSGSLVGGLTRMLNIVPLIVRGFTTVANTFRNAFSASIEGGASTLRATLMGIGSVGVLAAGGLVAVAVAIGVVSVAVGPAVAALSLLLGVVTALVASLSFGLLGAVGALAGSLLPLAAGIGVTVLAFKSLDKAQKEALKADFKPVVGAFKELGRSAAATVFKNVGDQARRLVPVIRSFNPIVREVGSAISGLGDYWTKALNSPGFKGFRDELRLFLPKAVTLLGRAFGNTLGGLGGLFRALMPITSQFLGWIEKVTGEFANWANTARGQNTLKEFFRRAGESAKALGDFAKEALDFVIELVDKGKGSGDSMITKMADAIKKAGDYLEAHPDALSDWFEDAEEFASGLGRLGEAALKLADALDNLGTRTGLTVFLTGITGIIDGVTWAFERFNGAIQFVITTIADFVTSLSSIRIPPLNFMTLVTGAAPAIASIATKFAGLPNQIITALAPLAGRVGQVFNRIGPVARQSLPIIGQTFRNLPNIIVGHLAPLAARVGSVFNRLPAPVRTVVRTIGVAFQPLVGRIAGYVQAAPGRVQSILGRLPGIGRTAAGNVASAFAPTLVRIRGHFTAVPGAVQTVFGRLPGIGRTAATNVISAFARVTNGIKGHFNGVPGPVASVLAQLATKAAQAANDVVAKFNGLAGRILNAVGNITFPKPKIPMPDIPHVNLPTLTWFAKVKKLFAAGGLVNGPTDAMIGEDGPEAVVPLNRPLSQVDPSVRWLSAIAQGMVPTAAAPAAPVEAGKRFNIEQMTVVTPNTDTRAVAAEVVNRLMAQAY